MNSIDHRIFTASPRPVVWTPSDYVLLAGKLILFPITCLYYLVSYLASCIAYPIGVANSESRLVNSSIRDQLKGIGGEEIVFQTEDKIKLEGMYFQGSKPQGKTVLLCTGSHKSYEHYALPMVEALNIMGFNVLAFNYRGFGYSEGTPSQKGFYLDAEAAYQYLRSEKNAHDEDLVALGYSMGVAPATDLATYHPISLVLDRYFASMHQVANDAACERFGFLSGLIAKGIFYLGDADFDIREKIKKVTGRIFLARGDQDQTMLSQHEEALKTSLKGRAGVTFQTVSSSHFHHRSSLWFHHKNPDPTGYQTLETFISQPVAF